MGNLTVPIKNAIEFEKKESEWFDHSHIVKINKIEVGSMGTISKNSFNDMELGIRTIFGCEINLSLIVKMLSKRKLYKIIIYWKII